MTDAPGAPTTRSRDRDWLDAPFESGRAAGFGVYLHVPFCQHRCGYCDFATYDDRGHLRERYVTGLREVIERASEGAWPSSEGAWPSSEGAWPSSDGARQSSSSGDGHPRSRDAWPTVTSVYVGGGTPTMLPGAELAEVVSLVRERFDVAPDAEITVEANPETADPDAFAALAEAGVNRMSLGAQSFAPHVLDTLERLHDPDRVPEAVATARAAGIANLNLDLIYGTPGETDADWAASLRAVVDLDVQHVSAYALTVAANTPLARHVAEGRLPPPDPDLQRDRFETARSVLAGAGFEHYEVSNWARGSGRRSRHNVLYWRHGDYLGLGVGAHGHVDGHRTWQQRSIERWLADVEDGRDPVGGDERLSDADRARERLLLGLRLREGLHPHDVPPIPAEAVQDAADVGLLELSCGRFQASEDGWYLLDELVRRIT